jgi:hypothetical protein
VFPATISNGFGLTEIAKSEAAVPEPPPELPEPVLAEPPPPPPAQDTPNNATAASRDKEK